MHISATTPSTRLLIVQQPSGVVSAPSAKTIPTPIDQWTRSQPINPIPATATQIQQDFGTQISPQKTPAPTYHGKEVAAMFLQNRTPQDIQTYLQSPFVTTVAEMTVLDRYKPALEDQLQDWFPFLKRSDLAARGGKVWDVNVAFQFKADPEGEEAHSGASLKWLKPTVGLKVAALNLNGVMIKPGTDLITYKDEHHNTVVLATGVAVNIQGKFYPDAEVIMTHGLVNSDTPDQPHTYLEGRSHYDSLNHQITMRVGARHEIREAQSVGVYGRYSHTITAQPKTDLGVGVYYEQKW